MSSVLRHRCLSDHSDEKGTVYFLKVTSRDQFLVISTDEFADETDVPIWLFYLNTMLGIPLPDRSSGVDSLLITGHLQRFSLGAMQILCNSLFYVKKKENPLEKERTFDVN